MKKLILGLSIFLLLCGQTQAGRPLWTFTPLSSNIVSLPNNGVANVQYRVTNQSRRAHTLALQSIANVSQDTSSGNCPNVFRLGYLESCILSLVINGNQLTETISGGPTVCDANYPLQCYSPSQTDSLSIVRVGSDETVSITVSPSNITLTVGESSKSFTITNRSNTVTATNIAPDLSGTALDGNVTPDASACSSLGPGQQCDITFTRKIAAVTAVNIPIQGDNTNQVGVSVAVDVPTEATIAVSAGSPLVLDGTTGTPVAGTLTITNNSPTLTATNIAAVLTGTALDGNVTQDSSNCSSLGVGQSCTLSFTPGSTAVAATSVIIRGTNTSETTATIAVNAPPEATIAISSGSPLSLSPSSSGTMTITNSSATEVASNIAANFSGTALSGLVTQSGSTCSSVNPGANCTLTFTAGATPVAQTSFTIQGDNTTAVTGAISISSPITLYGVTGSGSPDSPHSLFEIDPATGNATLVMSFTNQVSDGSVIASDGNTIYYWTGHGSPTFRSVDLNNQTDTIIPTSNYEGREVFGAVFYNSANGFLLTNIDERFGNMSTSGAFSLLGSHNSRSRGMACYQHRIFAVNRSNSNLYELNPSTGATIATTAMSTSDGSSINGGLGLTINPNTNTFYVLLKISGSNGRKLATLDISTGLATIIGTVGGDNYRFSSIAFNPADSSC